MIFVILKLFTRYGGLKRYTVSRCFTSVLSPFVFESMLTNRKENRHFLFCLLFPHQLRYICIHHRANNQISSYIIFVVVCICVLFLNPRTSKWSDRVVCILIPDYIGDSQINATLIFYYYVLYAANFWPQIKQTFVT